MGKKNKPEKLKIPSVKTSIEDRLRKYRNNRVSIFFLFWFVFSVFALSIVLIFGLSQYFITEKAYKSEASHLVRQSGDIVKEKVENGPPEVYGKNFSFYLITLEENYDVNICILDDNGRVKYPLPPADVDINDPEIQKTLDFSKEIVKLKKELKKQGEVATYEGNGEYVYGTTLTIYGTEPVYLYVEKSLELAETAMNKMGVQLTLMSIFAAVLSFAVSSAVSGWLVRPITEMTEKAKLLAQGDFNVDFHGDGKYAEETTELAETLNYARDEISKADRMQKELIANVSHDFKTPLTMIKAYASMIIEISGDVPEKRNKHAQVIVDEADRLTSLVNDVLDISKMTSGIETLKAEKVDLSKSVKEILERFAYLKEMKGYKFEADIDDGLFAVVDELKIGQALYNLIGNAVNYTGEDKTVYVSLKKESETAFRFTVRDTGKGIKPEELGEIWDRYYRSKESHKRPVQGTGLGLSIVKAVLQRHQLPFGADSEVGKGSVFYVVFPIAK